MAAKEHIPEAAGRLPSHDLGRAQSATPRASVEVDTVRGAIGTDLLGATLMHEHIFVISREILDNMPGVWDEERYVAEAIEQLQELHGLGITSIVDPTIIGLGRYIPRIERVARATNLNIIVGTGIYAYAEMPHYFRLRGPGMMWGGPDPIVELLRSDVLEGIGGTSVKASFLKFATETEGVTPDVARIMSATCDVHLETGAPILTHSNASSETGLVQQAFLSERGVDLTRVLIGHVGDSTDLDYLMRLADQGSILGMDRFGYTPLVDTRTRVEIVKRLCDRGYADRMVLGHDYGCFSDLVPADVRAQHLPDLSYTFISRSVLPLMRDVGVSQTHIDMMLTDNPRRFFESRVAGGG